MIRTVVTLWPFFDAWMVNVMASSPNPNHTPIWKLSGNGVMAREALALANSHAALRHAPAAQRGHSLSGSCGAWDCCSETRNGEPAGWLIPDKRRVVDVRQIGVYRVGGGGQLA